MTFPSCLFRTTGFWYVRIREVFPVFVVVRPLPFARKPPHRNARRPFRFSFNLSYCIEQFIYYFANLENNGALEFGTPLPPSVWFLEREETQHRVCCVLEIKVYFISQQYTGRRPKHLASVCSQLECSKGTSQWVLLITNSFWISLERC